MKQLTTIILLTMFLTPNVFAMGSIPKYSKDAMECALERKLERNTDYMKKYSSNAQVQILYAAANNRITDTLKYVGTLEDGKDYKCQVSGQIKVDACPYSVNDPCNN